MTGMIKIVVIMRRITMARINGMERSMSVRAVKQSEMILEKLT